MTCPTCNGSGSDPSPQPCYKRGCFADHSRCRTCLGQGSIPAKQATDVPPSAEGRSADDAKDLLAKALVGMNPIQLSSMLTGMLAGIIKLRLRPGHTPEELANAFRDDILAAYGNLPPPPMAPDAPAVIVESLDTVPVAVLDGQRDRQLEQEALDLLVRIVRAGYSNEELTHIMEMASANMLLTISAPELTFETAAEGYHRNILAVLRSVEAVKKEVPPS